LQLLPAQTRGSRAAAAARATKDRAATNFMVAVWDGGYQRRRRWTGCLLFTGARRCWEVDELAAGRRRFCLIPPQAVPTPRPGGDIEPCFVPGTAGCADGSAPGGKRAQTHRAARMAIDEARNAHVHRWSSPEQTQCDAEAGPTWG
jgi:hypothetical protein